MGSSLSKREINRQRWRERINAWKRSGQSQKAFCEHQQLGLASFRRWCGIFKAEAASDKPAPIGLLPVRVTAAKPAPLTVVLDDDLRIEIPPGFDPHALRQLVRVLRAS